MATIHPSALVDRRAELANDVEVGAFCVIGAHVRIGAGTTLASHVVIDGRTTIGQRNRIFSFASLGGPPQDKKYAGEATELVIGDGNTIREYCTFNTGTLQGGGVTRIGHDNWIMAYGHVAHDCIVGDHTIFANLAQIAGHVEVGDWAILGGMSGVHQFCRIGAHAMLGGGTTLVQDLPPYVLCKGTPAAPHGINVEGLKRRGYGPEAITALRQAYKALYRDGLTLAEAITAIDELIAANTGTAAALLPLRTFIAAEGRGIVR